MLKTFLARKKLFITPKVTFSKDGHKGVVKAENCTGLFINANTIYRQNQPQLESDTDTGPLAGKS